LPYDGLVLFKIELLRAWYDWTSTEYDNPNKDNAALDALWGAQMTYDYFLQTFGRNSYDGLGGQIRIYTIDTSDNPDNKKAKAGWYYNIASGIQWMEIGKGGEENGVTFDAFACLDIMAHEIGHGVFTTEVGAPNSYSWNTIVLNEGFSDIWGACVEYAKKPGSNSVWIIAENNPGGRRNIANPHA
jgi:Zn-dependent metalloprotease